MATYAVRHRFRLPSRKIPLRILSVWLLAALCSLTGGLEVYPSPHGPFWCYPCQPGFHVTVHCTQDQTNSSCTPCPKDTYAKGFNSNTFCTQCISVECPPNSPGYQLQMCSATQEADCLCQEGYYKASGNSSVVKCRIHSKCQLGEGEVYYGNLTHDTQCRQCIETSEYVDQTQPEHPKCRKCSTCDGKFFTGTACTLSADTICKEKSPPQDSNTEVPDLTITGESCKYLIKLENESVQQTDHLNLIIDLYSYDAFNQSKSLESATKILFLGPILARPIVLTLDGEALETTGQTESDSMIGIIVGLIVAIVVILVAIVVIIFCFWRKRRNRRGKNSKETTNIALFNKQNSTGKFEEEEKFIEEPTEKSTEEITDDGAPNEKSSNGETIPGNVSYDEENRNNETKVNLSEKSQEKHSDNSRA